MGIKNFIMCSLSHLWYLNVQHTCTSCIQLCFCKHCLIMMKGILTCIIDQFFEKKLNGNSFVLPFQTMEIRRLMLQIRRTSHRNSCYESGKMHMFFHAHPHNECTFFLCIYLLLSMCVNPAVCGHVVCPIRS